MTFRFSFEKRLQAAGVLLGLDGDRMERIRLLKLLYIADRELLAETGRTITGDRVVAMDHGPVLSQVYDLIKGQASRPRVDTARFRHGEPLGDCVFYVRIRDAAICTRRGELRFFWSGDEK